MSFKTEQRVIFAHAESVVGHTNQTASARLDFHGDARRLGIERVFHELLHDTGGALHHFAGGNLVGNVFRE